MIINKIRKTLFNKNIHFYKFIKNIEFMKALFNKNIHFYKFIKNIEFMKALFNKNIHFFINSALFRSFMPINSLNDLIILKLSLYSMSL